MIECNLTDVDLPERVWRIVDGIGAPPPSCGHCRQPGASLRCSRCKCVKYCSVSCQKEHFAMHKKNCKTISKKRTLVEKGWDDEKEGGHIPGSMWDMVREVNLTNSTTKTTIEMADLLVQVGYKESDTIANGSLYYREALKYYLLPMKLVAQDEFHEDWCWVEDRILLMLVILGADESHTQEWFFESGSHRNINYFPASDMSDIELDHDFELHGYSRDDLPFQAMLLLSQMKLMATYRKSSEGLAAYKETMQNAIVALGYSVSVDDIHKHISPFLMGESHEGKVELEVMPEQIRTIVAVLLHHNQGSFLAHLKHSIPLQISHAPTLFSPAHYNPEFFPGTPDAVAPSELWMIFQDCFFETPGMNDILDEFVPDELIGYRE